jgi:hypothetical protein
MPRSDDYDTSHIPDYPSWYMVFPSLLFVDGLGLVSAAAYAVAEDKDQSTRHLATVGLVLVTIHSFLTIQAP